MDFQVYSPIHLPPQHLLFLVGCGLVIVLACFLELALWKQAQCYFRLHCGSMLPGHGKLQRRRVAHQS
ncbi:MAG TPA: hypothetical protein VMU24_04245 [Candidatus Acidoferrales bacterium]|nr:hypothetical protein [Candidatus Acidoferrales bacterium]